MKKKKILLLSDDLRMHSGIATMSREFVIGTCETFDWVQIGGAIKHPEEGKVVDMSQALLEEENVKGFLKIYPISGYGNPDMLREIIHIEKPDAILHFTDPRFWTWLYNMEHEIRQQIPIMYYNIWDDLPDPEYNKYFYKSCDLLLAISKQTYGINKRLLPEYEDWQIKYLPHGINQNKFYNLNDSDFKLKKFKEKFKLDNDKFKLLYLNRNVRRKQPGDFILAYTEFLNKLTTFERDNCCLVIHAEPVDDNGTDMRALVKQFMPEQNVIFTYDIQNALDLDQMNYLYNSVDIYMNIASNEGFGLGSAEALMTETPIIVNVTGGLQDQCGFKKEDGSYLTADDYVELGSNHEGDFREHGPWSKPVFPTNISLQGSPMTPYIFDDRCSYKHAGHKIYEWFLENKESRNAVGKVGREFLLDEDVKLSSKAMCEGFVESINMTFDKFKPKSNFTMEVV
jgi:glycosyltransferase involved in cell wall biosynthesis